MDISALQGMLDPKLIRLLAAKQEADQTALEQSPQPATPVQETAPIAAVSDIPAFTPEEKDSLMASAGRKALSGLQWVGESLDKPGRAVRGVLGGEFNEIFDIIPFSDTLGLTTPEDDVSGRDLLETYGVLGENKPGLDVGDVAGVGLEMVTDPFAWMSFGGAKAASQVLGKGADMAKAITPAAKADEIAAGLRPLMTVHTPSIGIPLPQKIPFTDIEIPRVQTPVRELAQYGANETGAKIYKAVNYGAFSPNPYVRKLFSSLPEVNELPVKQQEMADRLAEARIAAQDAAGADAVKMFAQERGAAEAFSGLADRQFFGGENGRMSLIADAVRDSSGVSKEVQSMLRGRLGDNVDWAAVKGDKKKLAEVGKIYDAIVADKKKYGELADDLKVRHEELLSNIQQGLNGDPLDAHWFDDSIREFVERKDGLGLSDVVDKLKTSGFDQSVEGFDAAAQSMYDVADSMRGLYKNMQKELKRLGVDVDDLNDFYVGYSHRRPEAPAGSPLFNYLRRRLVKTDGAPFMIARDDTLRNIPLGTRAINEMARDPLFTAIKHNKEGAKAQWSSVGGGFMPELSRAPQPGHYTEAVHKLARDEGVSYAGMLAMAREVRKADEAARAAVIQQNKAIYNKASGIDPQWRKSVNAAVKANLDYTSVPRFDEIAEALGMESQQAWDLLKQWNKKTPKKSHDDIAREALERYRSVESYASSEAGDVAFNPDLFDVTKDKTAFPDGVFNEGGLEYTRDNAAFLLAHKYNLPAWWNYDKIIRENLKKSKDLELAKLAQDASLSDHKFNEAWWELQKSREAGLSEDMKWATDAGDVDDFTVRAKEMMPELEQIPIMYQSDLHDLVNKLYHMPKQVLEEGLFNRGTTTDAVDYLMHATRLKAGVASLRSILRGKDVVQEAGEGGVSLAKAWGKDGAKLTDEGLKDFARELWGDLPDEQLAAKLETATVSPDVAQTMTRYIEGFRDPERIAELLKWTDAFNGLFKGTLTVPYPAFHTRNRLSGIFANWASGIYDAKAEQKAQDLFFGKLDPQEAEEYLSEIKSLGVASMGGGGTGSQVFDQLEKFRGVGSDGRPAIATGENNYKNLGRFITNPFGELVEDTRAAFDAAGGGKAGTKAAAKQLFRGGQRADGSTATDLNPFGIAGGIDPLRKAEGQLDEFGKPLAGAAKKTVKETTNAVYKAGTNANDYVEWMNRVAPYIALRQAGWPANLAARKVRQVQFDYRELSQFERRIMRRVIPFYSFMRKNLEQQVRLLMQNPGGRTAQAIRVENKAAREGKGKEGYVPKYLAESLAVRLPGGNERDAKYFSQSGLFPFEEAFNRFSFDDGLMPLNMRRTGEKFLAQSHPLIQGPAEFITGKQFWSGRNLDDLYQSPTSDQDINLFMSKLPVTRLINTVGGLFDDRKNLAEKAFNLAVGGAKITDVDPVKQRALETRDILEQTLASDPDIARYTGLYANDMENLIARYNEGDQEAAKMLRLYQEIAKELRAMKKESAAAPAPMPAG